MTQEEKAQRYDEAVERAREYWETDNDNTLDIKAKGTMEYLFPELAESEDERIRKGIVKMIYDIAGGFPFEKHGIIKKEALAWLEKQGEPTEINPSEFDLRLNKLLKQFESLPKEELISNLSYYLNVIQNDGTYKIEKQDEKLPVGFYYVNSDGKKFYSDTFKYGDVILHVEKQGEQKPAMVEPKFKVGDIIRLKDGDGLEWTVEEVLNNGYYTIVCADRDDFIQLDDKWELVGQKPAWSEEDEAHINSIIDYLLDYKLLVYEEDMNVANGVQKELDWLKSLKEKM